jgi:hypothetical protein
VTRLVFLFVALLLLAGCPRPTPKGTERLSSPAAGSVRVLAVRVKETPEILHYQWSLLGERNWTTPSVSEGKASLSDVYKLNDPTKVGGCHTWLCDVIFTKKGSGQDWQWELRLRGSNGKTATETGTGSGTPEFLVKDDQDTKLSADIPLAKLGEKTLTLAVPK